jgi:Ser/Thr protein kinase RdoA (MazF antagonist)
MSLKLMHAVIKDLEAGNAIAQAILELWMHDPGSAHFLRASANFVFTFTDDGAPRVLRFNRLEDRNVKAVEAELGFVRHLSSKGVLIARPILSRFGHDVECVSTPLGDFSAAVFEFISGAQPALEEMTMEQLAAWGGALATLHNAAERYPAPDRSGWREHLALADDSLMTSPKAGRELLRRVRYKLDTLPVSDTNFGLIHFDFEPDNLVWQDSKVWALDFDDCARYPFAADIAFALRELFNDRPADVDLNDNCFRTFISGYRTVRSVSDNDLSRIPLFLAAHNLLSYAKVKRSLADTPDPNEPDWLVGLRRRLEDKVEQYEQGFANTATD